MCNKNVQQKCATKMCNKNAQQKCTTKMCNKNVQQKYGTKIGGTKIGGIKIWWGILGYQVAGTPTVSAKGQWN